jgi:eukaryotic-like serine/threonine-protein kinase
MALAPEKWQEVKELFEAVLEQPSEERSSFLRRACAEDAIVGEVERLLAYHTPDSEFLVSPLERLATSRPKATTDPAESAGTLIGRYRLLQRIGEGGMGEVWLAEQKEPVRRRVAVKLVKAGMNTREVMGRFESERQAVALMDHPAIAKVFDAGSTPQGAPYFVMEYVAGVPITVYCDNHRLSIRERLELFIDVCGGVQHAHHKAIIHRDLKPSNILVMEVDGRAAPKIIDFGVAKALTRKLIADTMFTRAGVLVGTPEYMSPEQANSSGEDIDTRTDVYSLGMIFYQLLAGVPPIELRKISFEEFLRRLREEEPPKPSTKLRTYDEPTSMDVARKRQSETRALAKQMRGELDSISLKALEKDRSRRYGSPSDFAADIRRYLNNEAVLAVPPSAAYRARKFARRYRGPLLMASVLALVLIVAAAVSIRQSIRANREAIRANREAAVAEAVNDFLQNDLLAQASAATQSGPSAKPDPHLEVRTALDRAAERIEGKFAKQPEVEAAIRDTIGQTYTDLGLYREARKQLERAVDLRRRVLGPEHPETLNTMDNLAMVYREQGSYQQAEALEGQTLEIRRRVLGPEHANTLRSMANLAIAYEDEGKFEQAEALDSQVLEIQQRLLGPEHPNTLTSMNDLALVYRFEGKYEQAEALQSQTLGIRRRVLGPEHPKTLRSMSNLAAVYHEEGKYAQAEALCSQVLEIRRRVLGPEHSDTLMSMSNLASVYQDEGKYAQAEALDSQSLEIRRRVLGPDHPDTLRSTNGLSIDYDYQGKYGQAEALQRHTLEIRRRVLGPDHPDTLVSMNNLADDYTDERKYTQAEALFSQTLEIGRRVLGAEHPYTLTFLSGLASMYQGQGKYALAEVYAAQALAGRRHALKAEHPDTMVSAADLALAYQSQGKFAASEPLAREAMEVSRKNRPDDWQGFRAESLVGASLAGQKKYGEAEPLLIEGYQGMVARESRMTAGNRYHLDRAREWIVELYQAWDKPEKAAEWKKRSTERGPPP